MKKTLFAIFNILNVIGIAQSHLPSFEEVISLHNLGNVIISPDGMNVAFTVQTTDWNDNRYDSEIWLSKNLEEPFRLTNNPKNSSSAPLFSPDGKWISFLSDRGNKVQIYVIRVEGGEAMPVTAEEEGISYYEWHPDGKSLIFVKPEEDDGTKKEREKRYGEYEIDDREFRFSHIWQIAFKPDMPAPSEMPCYETVDSLKSKAGCIVLPESKRLTKGSFTVTGFSVSPDGSKIAFSHQPDPLINSFIRSDISVLELASGKITKVVSNPGRDSFEDWSPDSREIIFTTNLDDTISSFYKNSFLFALNIQTGEKRRLATKLDADFSGLNWEKSGIYTTIWQRTARPLLRIDPVTGVFSELLNTTQQIYNYSFSRDGQTFAYTGRESDGMAEVYVSSMGGSSRCLTDMNGQIKDWKVAGSEVISWKSKDGTVIEGVLHKPFNYDPLKKYPLMVVIHGGPAGIDTPNPVPNSGVYPLLQWLDKGCLVLRPNYRGSEGYGESFRSLNVRNLGVGDMWDVISGIEYLDKKGLIDKNRMGCMGWSQGGFISAFLTTNTSMFRAISVGAGISDWMTYYVNTDIHPFTIQYLKATPWTDEDIYRKTSPITNINKASTPTLIQHGELDKRVPIANAYELLQGLRDKKVPAELIVYKGFGHGITKPRERLAATWHNWQWFNRYIWEEEVELPVGARP